MTLSETIRERQSRRARTVNRERQDRAELRMDEIVSVAEIATDYDRADRAGDIEIEGHFQALYQLVDTEDERKAVARAYRVWMAAERREDVAVRGSVEESVGLLKANNSVWIDGAAVPSDSERGA